jgi:uncharacterized membrane protein
MHALYMDAEITPARSLSKRGLYVVMGITIGLAAIPAIYFTILGAHLVLPFLGLDVLGLWYAFHVMRKNVGAERVRVSSEAVEVLRDDERIWSSPTAFTRVEEYETAVRLAVSGRRTSVAKALSPEERSAFARALDDAIRAARRERYPGA